MRCHSVQFDVVQGDWTTNRPAIEALIEDANPTAGDLVVLPEVSDTGWSLDIDGIADNGSLAWAEDLASRHQIWLQVGYVQRDGSRGRNQTTICSPEGDAVATYTKIHACNPMGEGTRFTSGDHLVIVDTGRARICPLTCYDLRFPEIWRLAALEGVDIFSLAANWPASRIDHWTKLLQARGIDTQAFVVAANRFGTDKDVQYGGRSAIISFQGTILAEASDTTSMVISASCDPNAAAAWRHEFPVADDINRAFLGSVDIQKVNPTA
jgi:predicted amidohydrolase